MAKEGGIIVDAGKTQARVENFSELLQNSAMMRVFLEENKISMEINGATEFDNLKDLITDREFLCIFRRDNPASIFEAWPIVLKNDENGLIFEINKEANDFKPREMRAAIVAACAIAIMAEKDNLRVSKPKGLDKRHKKAFQEALGI